MTKIYVGFRDPLGNKIIVMEQGKEDYELPLPNINPMYRHSTWGFDWGKINETDTQYFKGDYQNPTRWGGLLESARSILNDVYGDLLSDFTVRMGRFQAVRFYKDFALEVLADARDEWALNEAEIRTWLHVKAFNRKQEDPKARLAVPKLIPSVDEVVPSEAEDVTDKIHADLKKALMDAADELPPLEDEDKKPKPRKANKME